MLDIPENVVQKPDASVKIATKPARPPVSQDEQIIQTDREGGERKAHRVYEPTSEDISLDQQLEQLYGSSVIEDPQPPFLGIPVKPKIQMHRYDTAIRGDTITDPVSKKQVSSHTREHNYGSYTAVGESLGSTPEEVLATFETEFTRKGVNTQGINLVVGPAYQLVTRDGITYPERMPGQLTMYEHHEVVVTPETAVQYNPWRGIQLPPEDVSQEEHLSDTERFKDSREHPAGIETTRGVVGYHNELVDYDQEIYLNPKDNKNEITKRTIFYRLINDLISKNPQQSIRLLDLGCGNGQFLRELKKLFGDKIETHGVTARTYNRDGNPIMEEAKEQEYLDAERKNGIDMKVKNMSDLAHFSSDYFDLVVSAEGINYAGDPIKVVEQSSRVLKDGGLMLAGHVAIKIEGVSTLLAGNTIFNPKLGFEGLTLTKKVQNTPLKTDVICFNKKGEFLNSQLQFSHSIKSKNGAVYIQ